MKNFPAPLSPLPHPLSSQQIKLGFFTHRLEWLRCTCLGCSGAETEWSSEHWTPLLAPIEKGRSWGPVASLWAWASSKENSLLKDQMQLLQSMSRKDIVLSHMSGWPHMIPYIQGFNFDGTLVTDQHCESKMWASSKGRLYAGMWKWILSVVIIEEQRLVSPWH